MIQYTLKAGATSQIIPISIFDSSSTTGAKLAGLVYNSAGLTAYYNRTGAAGAATAITLATATKGTWASSGFVAIDGTNMPGDYELHIPDAAIAAGATSVLVQLKGATNMVPVNILIQLTVFDLQTATQKVDVDTIKTQAVTCGAGVTILASVGTAATSTAQTGDSFAVVKSGGTGDNAAIKTKTDFLPSATAGATGGVFIAGTNAATTITTALTATFTGNLTGTVAKSPATLAAADVSGNLPVDLQTIKTQAVTCAAGVTIPTSIASPTNITAGTITTATNLTTNNDKTGYSLSVTPPTAVQVRQEMDSSSTKLANLDAAVSSRSTYSGGAVASVTAGVTVSTNNDKTGYTVSTVQDKTGYSLANVVGFKKNTAFNNFEFFMRDSSDHSSAKIGLTVTAQRSIDGGSFASCANSVSEVGIGIYKINLATTDLNGDNIAFAFSSSGADTTYITIKTNQ